MAGKHAEAGDSRVYFKDTPCSAVGACECGHAGAPLYMYISIDIVFAFIMILYVRILYT